MRNQGYMYIGIAVIVLGLLILVGQITGLGPCAFFWPLLFIALGVVLLLRPRLVPEGTRMHILLVGDVRRDGPWTVSDEEIWLLVGDVRLDLTAALIPEGETRLRVIGFVGGVRVRVPEDIGVALSSIAFVTDARFLEQKRETFLAPYYAESDGYAAAARKIRLETFHFVSNLNVKRN